MGSMNEHLLKLKRQGKIDFISVPLDWGRSYSEFLVRSYDTCILSRIFYDGKYREDYIEGEKLYNLVGRLEAKVKLIAKDVGIGGIYDSTTEYKELNRQLNFIKLKN